MANSPPPYVNITGISRTVMKDNAQETLTNYNGNARPGEIVADLTTNPPALYVGNNAGQLTAIISTGSYSNANVAAYLPTYTGNIAGGNVEITGYLGAGNIGVSDNVATKTLVTDPGPLSNFTAAWGARAFISDGNLTAVGNFGAQVSGGGGNSVPVWSDGANWYIG
jgi:hypothetical protein